MVKNRLESMIICRLIINFVTQIITLMLIIETADLQSTMQTYKTRKSTATTQIK